jgi:hypothetical protein
MFKFSGGCMRPTLILALLATPVWAQATAHATVLVPCSVRVRSPLAADYDPASEFTLEGMVLAAQGGVIKLLLPMGVVRILVGSAFPPDAVRPGQTVAVLGARTQDDHSQWFVAREIRRAESTLILRDAQGVPVH